ncbi:hypothetical protein, partial [Kitasatospora sp. NPDC057198]|uniref:hypothetical protein n=1 Tax=Kitasatospora sp. NPDC057198 TaxID=3346046 RepID=UPI00364175C0
MTEDERPAVRPRPLNAAERAVLEHLLSADFPGAAELRAGLDELEVVGAWFPGSLSVDLARRGRRPAGSRSWLLPVGGEVYDAA